VNRAALKQIQILGSNLDQSVENPKDKTVAYFAARSVGEETKVFCHWIPGLLR
jgi:hypothetical protein